MKSGKREITGAVQEQDRGDRRKGSKRERDDDGVTLEKDKRKKKEKNKSEGSNDQERSEHSVSHTEDDGQQRGPRACHPTRYDAQAKAEELRTEGFTVVPIDWMTGARLVATQQRLVNELHSMPEFKQPTDTFVLGGFSALGNPSSFHNLTVRELRQQAFSELLPLFSQTIDRLSGGRQQWKLEQLIDRVLYRKTSLVPPKESWHRDESPLSKQGDIIFGGWWNLTSNHKDLFSCVPRTHQQAFGGLLRQSSTQSGFTPIKDEDMTEIYSKRKKLVSVPPGCILIFNQLLVHEILAKKLRVDLLRVFLCWRLTQSSEPLIANISHLLEEQAVVPLKSGQIPPLYAKLHWTNWRSKIVEFTEENVQGACTEMKQVKSGKDAGENVVVVHQHMRSLTAYAFPKYPDYSREEASLYKPSSRWTKILCGLDNQVHDLVL
jgi:hypothetical protein